MMVLGHEIVDYEINRTVLVDHAILIAGGQNQLGQRNSGWAEQLDASKRRSIIFMDRNDIIEIVPSLRRGLAS